MGYNYFYTHCAWRLGGQLNFRVYIREPDVYQGTNQIILDISRIYPADNQPVATAMGYKSSYTP